MKLKFLNLNILWGGQFFDEVVDFIKKEDPDIFSLQEVYDGKGLILPKNLRTLEEYKNIFSGYNFDFCPTFAHVTDYGAIDIGNAVFTKFKIKETENIFYDAPYREELLKDRETLPFSPRALQHVVVDYSGVKINVFNTHGIWGFDDKDNEARLHMSEVIIEHVKNKEHVILSGDFNVDQSTQTIMNIEKYLVNVFRGTIKSSFNLKMKTDPGFADSVVDIVLMSKDMKIVETECRQVEISDHLPLIAILEI